MKYSPSTHGFYHPEISPSIPTDSFDISDELYSSLLDNQGKGMAIGQDEKGFPISLPIVELTQLQKRQLMTCTRVDFKINLLNIGKLQSTLDIMAGLPDTNIVKIKWVDAHTFIRTDPDLESFCLNELGLTDEQIDQLFTPLNISTGN